MIRNSQVAKKEKQTHQNAAGTKEYNKLIEDDIPILDKISPEMQQKLKDARNAKSMNQSDLAKALNVNVSIIKDYENGTVAKFNKGFYNRVLRVLGVSPK